MKQSRWQFGLKNRHVWLLVSLLFLEVLYPLSRSLYSGFRLLEFFFVIVFFACIFAAAERRRYFIVAVVLAVPSLLSFGSVLGVSLFGGMPPNWLVWARLIASTLLLSFSACLVMADTLRAKHVRVDTICAAVSVYLIVGMIWALCYSMAAFANPTSILLPDLAEQISPEAAGFENFGALTYFSFVTLSTLGYGEIIPATPITRMLAWTEAMFGQIYLAVLVARIVGLHVAAAVTARGWKPGE